MEFRQARGDCDVLTDSSRISFNASIKLAFLILTEIRDEGGLFDPLTQAGPCSDDLGVVIQRQKNGRHKAARCLCRSMRKMLRDPGGGTSVPGGVAKSYRSAIISRMPELKA